MKELLARINRLSDAQRRLLRLRLNGIRPERAGDARLVGCVVPHTPGATTPQDLRRFLSERLPDYMVPSAWVLLEAFPQTSRGKIDRAALRTLARPAAEAGTGQSTPRNETEGAIAAIWAEALGLRSVGCHDNFFDLGGHSLLLPKVLTKVRAIAHREISMVDLFRYPTVAALATHVGEGLKAAAADTGVGHLKTARDAGVRRLKQRRAQQQTAMRAE